MAGTPAQPMLHRRDGRVVFGARRPTALVVPLAMVTEAAGILILLTTHDVIGWFVIAAPAIALVVTGIILRPTLELTREGLVQRQYPFTSLTRWEVIDHVGIVRAGNRVILAYRLVPGIPPPRRQPAAALLRAAGRPYDGGFFVDSLAGDNAAILSVVDVHVRDASRRDELPPARRR